MNQTLDPAQASRWRPVFLTLLVLAGAPALVELWDGLALLGFPFATNRIEAQVIDGVLRVADGERLYLPVGPRPWLVHIYHPGTYLPAGLLGRLLSLDPAATVLVGRSIAAASALGIAAALTGWLRSAGAPWALSLIAGGSLFAVGHVALPDWYRVRPETLALLLTVGCLLALRRPGGRRRLLLAAALGLGAFLVKQPYFLAPLVGALWLLTTDRRREGIWFAAVMATGVLAWLAVAPALFGDAVFANTYSSMANNDVQPLRGAAAYGPMLLPHVGVLGLATALAVYSLRADRGDGRLLTLWLGAAAAWAFWAAGKLGAGPSYFSETTIAASLLVTLACWRAVQADGGKRRPLTVALIALLGLHLALAAASIRGDRFATTFDEPDPDLTAAVAALPDERPLLITHERLALAMGDPEGLDWYLWDLLVDAGLFDPEELLQRVRRGEYVRVALSNRPTSRLEVAIFEELKTAPYTFEREGPKVTVWVRSPQGE